MQYAAGVRYRIVQLATADHGIYDLTPYLFRIVVGFSTYLLETGALEMDEIRRDPYFIWPHVSGIIQFPGRCGNYEFRFKHSVCSII